MREVLFRGKRKDNGEWVYGWLGHLHCHNPRAKTIDSIYFTEITEDHDSTMNIIVDYETVGQYTGLTDKNGNKIFEGDICSKFSNYSGKKIYFPIVFEQGLYYAKYSETAGMPLCDICENVEVIGNIHDNPELLKGGAE